MIKIAQNKKTGNKYRILREDIINKNNNSDGEIMIMYTPVNELIRIKNNIIYVRNKDEFYKKFKIL